MGFNGMKWDNDYNPLNIYIYIFLVNLPSGNLTNSY